MWATTFNCHNAHADFHGLVVADLKLKSPTVKLTGLTAGVLQSWHWSIVLAGLALKFAGLTAGVLQSWCCPIVFAGLLANFVGLTAVVLQSRRCPIVSTGSTVKFAGLTAVVLITWCANYSWVILDW